jgi:8-oxo-dGTP pyrophosphatase MutT (NUDIX family)
MMTLDVVRSALRLPHFDPTAAHERMAPGTRPRMAAKTERSHQAGVLVLLYPESDDLHIILTRRTDSRDPFDKSFTATALRETCEELGVCDVDVEIIGSLSPIYIPPSDFEVFPTVGALPSLPVLRPNPAEVAEVFTLPLRWLLDEQSKRQEYRDFQGQQVLIPYYDIHDHKVWGATALILSELEQRLRAVLLQ